MASVENLHQWRTRKVDQTTPFTFILLGKDGGEKYRSETLVTMTPLFVMIDAMPMRRNELKKNQH